VDPVTAENTPPVPSPTMSRSRHAGRSAKLNAVLGRQVLVMGLLFEINPIVPLSPIMAELNNWSYIRTGNGRDMVVVHSSQSLSTKLVPEIGAAVVTS